jgi:hypothetical protein
LGPGARLRDLSAQQVVEEIMHNVPVPGGDPLAGRAEADELESNPREGKAGA